MKTSKIIHQIWGGEKSLPLNFKSLSQTWIDKHPDWQYEFWDDERISHFVEQYFPQYISKFKNFSYNIQRWDSARYLILYKYGGMYLDYDTECLESLEPLLKNKECWFALEPEEHRMRINKPLYISNAIFGAIPKHPILGKIIQRVFHENLFSEEQLKSMRKDDIVMNTTGPYMLIDFYERLPPEEQNNISLIPAKYLSPFSVHDARFILSNKIMKPEKAYLDQKLRDAYAVHYFFSDWVNDL